MLKLNNNNSLHLGGGHKPHYDSVSKLANPFKKAFTLAEIMITIGIIGVVAAITIPLLIQNSNSKKFTTQFKKSLSTLNQAAIGAQAQYDLDYSLLSQVNDDATCKSDTLAGGQYTFCGLFNNTLAGQTYLGKYGNVKGANALSPYSADVTSFSIENFLFFSFADGAIVAFNPNAKGCGVGVGNVITTAMLSDKLANCIGFIDVNGTTPPNKEVQCAEGTTTISANTTCKVTNGSMGDIFPVVFHDGAVEPATNASLAAFLGGNGKEEHDGTGTANSNQKIVNGKTYEYDQEKGKYYRTDENNNKQYLCGQVEMQDCSFGFTYNSTTDGKLKYKLNDYIYMQLDTNNSVTAPDGTVYYRSNQGPYYSVDSNNNIDFSTVYMDGHVLNNVATRLNTVNSLASYYADESGQFMAKYGAGYVYEKSNEYLYANGSGKGILIDKQGNFYEAANNYGTYSNNSSMRYYRNSSGDLSCRMQYNTYNKKFTKTCDGQNAEEWTLD